MKNLLSCFIATLFLTNISYAQKSNNKALNKLKPEINTAAIDSFEYSIKNDISNKKISGGIYLLYEKGKIVATNREKIIVLVNTVWLISLFLFTNQRSSPV